MRQCLMPPKKLRTPYPNIFLIKALWLLQSYEKISGTLRYTNLFIVPKTPVSLGLTHMSRHMKAPEKKQKIAKRTKNSIIDLIKFQYDSSAVLQHKEEFMILQSYNKHSQHKMADYQHEQSEDDWQPLNSKMNSNDSSMKRLKTQQNQYESRRSHKSKIPLKVNNNILIPKKVPKPYDFNPFQDFGQQCRTDPKQQEILKKYLRDLFASKQDAEKVIFVLSQNKHKYNKSLSQYRAILAKGDVNIPKGQNQKVPRKIKVTELFKVSGQKQQKPLTKANQKHMGSTFYRYDSKNNSNSYKPSETEHGNTNNTSRTFESQKKINNKQKNLQKILKIRQHLRKINNCQFRKVKNQVATYQTEKRKKIDTAANRKENSQIYGKQIKNNKYKNNEASDFINLNYNGKKILKQADRSVKRFVKVEQNKFLYFKPQSFKTQVSKQKIKMSINSGTLRNSPFSKLFVNS